MSQVSAENKLKYRPDIDGLRAIAVLSVIIFHIDERLLPGGFVGVDIFFVISGYLITQQICRELDKNTFKLSEFYRRRIKRIIPAMVVVVIFVLVASLLVHRPADTQSTAIQAVFSVFSLANVYFWLFENESYFAQASNEIPLLHLWSLGVEEQFYIFWPVVLILIYSRFRMFGLFVGVVCIAFVSFLIAQIGYRYSPSFVYYMLPTRAGELLLGALVAFVVVRNKIPSLYPNIANILGVFALMLIGLSFYVIDKDSVFPGFIAVLPTAATALLIFCGLYHDSIVNRLLTVRVLVVIGLLSYSAYLWHWPLLAFYRYAGLEVRVISGIVLFSLTFILAAATYYLVERPIRRSKSGFWSVVLRCYVIPGSMIVGLCVPVVLSGGYFMHRKADEYKQYVSGALPAFKYDYVCQKWLIDESDILNESCVLGESTDTEKSILLWGDSNAAHYVGVMGVFAREAGFSFKNLAHASCPPLNIDPEPFVAPKRYNRCADSLENMQLATEKFDAFIISANWVSYSARSEQFFPRFFEMTDSIINAGKEVVLLGKVPRVEYFDRLCLEKKIGLEFLECEYSPGELSADIKTVNDKLEMYASGKERVSYFDLIGTLCKSDQCSVYDDDGNLLYYDKSHLSMPGSWLIGESVVRSHGRVPVEFESLYN